MHSLSALTIFVPLTIAGCADRAVETTRVELPGENAASVVKLNPNALAREMPVTVQRPLQAIKSPLRCELRGSRSIKLGQTPWVKVTITNQTGQEIYLVGSLDDSDTKSRFPHCYFEVTGPDGKPPEIIDIRCGFQNPLKVNDFVRVGVGGRFNPYQAINGHGFFSSYQISESGFPVAGKYRVRFVYSTAAGNLEKWQGTVWRDQVTGNKNIQRLFKRVPKVEVKSNVIEVTVVERKG